MALSRRSLAARIEPSLAALPAAPAPARIGHNGGPGLAHDPDHARAMATREWLGAKTSRLTADLPGAHSPAPNRDIRAALATLRSRSRFLAQNDGYTRGFLKLLRRHVVGPRGFNLQMRIADDRVAGGLDAFANATIEAGFAEWSKAGVCDVTGGLSFAELCRLAIAAVARDGEALIRMVPTPANRFGFALQILDASRLDERLNGRPPEARLAPGHTVRMGVELDPWQRPVAYWIASTVPNDDPMAEAETRRVSRVPAEEIAHLFLRETAEDVRGVPWIASAIRTLAMLDGYGEAELAAARESANKMGFFTADSEVDLPGTLESDGRMISESEPGAWTFLPKGVEATPYDPQHPTQAFGDFVRAMLRSAAAGTGVSYNSFANDAGGLNYSALRATELEDRDEWRTLQNWLISGLCERVFGAWLREAMIAGAISLPMRKFDRFNAPKFIGRGWQWVDPESEAKANKLAVELGVRSRTKIIGEGGEDFDDTLAELLAEEEAIAKLLDLRRRNAATLAALAAPAAADPAEPAAPAVNPRLDPVA